MKTSTSEGKHRIQLDDLDFANDLVLLSQTQQQMHEKTTSVAAVSAAVSLNIHKGKSKILRYNTACTNPITIDGEDLEDVKTFTYLGSIINEHGGSDANVKARIGKARAAYLQLRNIWNSKQLSINTKESCSLAIHVTLKSSTEVRLEVIANILHILFRKKADQAPSDWKEKYHIKISLKEDPIDFLKGKIRHNRSIRKRNIFTGNCLNDNLNL
ncbi:unnamed protein product [Schistosoma margrebowiei]|uniref:Uncharacterized protein n=1 Tax=Schistosoma margrebowiei TaxID=48269 RepID=A0A183LC71_9TREM|nr:unnamed protein product [Schistosoma margrebowiei]